MHNPLITIEIICLRQKVTKDTKEIKEIVTKVTKEIKLVNRYKLLYSDYKSSETEDTSSNSGLEISTDTSSHSTEKKVKKKTKNLGTENKQQI